MESLSGKELARRIQLILIFLKKKKVNQSDIEQRLNYTSLSKAKNFDRYPQSIIEKKSRNELYEELLSSFNLKYDENNDRIISSGNDITVHDNSNNIYYLMYYYAFARETVGKAIVKIRNKRNVTIEYILNELWEGTVESIENYTFIHVQKVGNTTPVKKLICLFNGTVKYGRPYLIGCYSTVKRDGFPAAGNLLLEKISEEKAIKEKIKSSIDPRIYRYLNNKVIITETITPNNLEELFRDYSLINKYIGDYTLYYMIKKEVKTCNLELHSSCVVILNISDIIYRGTFKFLDSQTIKIDINDESSFSQLVKEEISLIISTNNSKYSPFYPGYGISNVIIPNKMNFKCLISPKSNSKLGIGKKEIEFLIDNN